MARITMAATTEVEVGDREFVEVEVEIAGDENDDGAVVTSKLAGALASLNAASSAFKAEEAEREPGASSVPMT